ncbi:MAG: Gfo/Idh/MocA family oxidoreductase [bacterium]
MSIRVGIVGCGGTGTMHRSCIAVSDQAQLVAVWDIDQPKCRVKAEEWGADASPSFMALLERSDIDAVYVTTPTPSHCEIVLAALDHKKHVFVEKPLARTLEQGRTMVEAMERSGLVCMVGQCIRFWPEYRILKDALTDGRWGKLITARFHRTAGCPSWDAGNWFADGAQSGGAALDLHTHDTDFVVSLLGQPESVRSFGTYTEKNGWWQIVTQYVYPGGPQMYAEGAWYFVEEFPFNMSFRANFEGGILDYDMSRRRTLLFHPVKGKTIKPRLPRLPKMKGEGINISDLGAYYLEDQHFFECIVKGRKPETSTFKTSYESAQVVFAEIRSAEESRPVAISEMT